VNGWDVTRVKTSICPLFIGHNSNAHAGMLSRSNKSAVCEDGVKALELTGNFFDADVWGDSELGKIIEGNRLLVDRGLLKTTSVGFVPLEGGFRWPSEEERATLGMPPWGAIYDGQELLELSITPIPAQRNARRTKDARDALKGLVLDGQITKDTADLLAEELNASEVRWILRVQGLSRTVVPLARELPWIRVASAAVAPVTSDASDASNKKSLELPAEFTQALTKAVQDAMAAIARDVRTLHRDAFAGIREMLDPIEDAITEAADELGDAATRLGLGRKDSERAEVSDASAPNGASATSAASTGTSRENPTTPTESRAGKTLLAVLCPALAGTEDNDAAADRRNEAQGVQDRQ
jgi:hypothetical protein